MSHFKSIFMRNSKVHRIAPIANLGNLRHVVVHLEQIQDAELLKERDIWLGPDAPIAE